MAQHQIAKGPPPLLPWGLLGIVTVPLGILALITYCRVFPPIIFGDVGYYAAALPALVSDAPLYDPASLQPHVLPPPPFWDQAPSAAVFAAILLLPAPTLVWGFLMLAFVLAGLLIILPRLGGGAVLMAPVLAVLPPVVEAMAWANLGNLVFLCLAVALRWPRAAGWAVGIAAAAKLIPILLVAWLIGRRDWRGLWVALAVPAALTAVAMVFAGPSVVVDFVMVRLNQSPTTGVFRVGLSDLGVPEVVTWILAIAISGAAAWRASFSLGVIAILAASPAMHMHYWTLAMVPLFVIWIPWVIARLNSPQLQIEARQLDLNVP
jgi:alpha-1,2-mannosyltransferase